MSIRLLSVLFTITGSLMMLTGPVRAGQEAPIAPTLDTKLENTRINVRDKNDTTLTPEDQQENPSDLNITANIRKALVEDKWLSVNAKNVKIITRNGTVTLRGPVENEAEKMQLQHIVKQMAGVVQLDNQLESKAP
ncbi:MAG: BON domain-containing protein [Methylovulum sp.]|nr:BON domain-containing protein [Methylovulum sp.]